MEWFSLFFTTFGLIFAIIDPFGYVPAYLAMTARDTDEHRRKVLKRACSAAFAVLVFFTFFGEYFLMFFGISIPALQFTGGLILLFTAFEMLRIFPFHQQRLSESEETEAAHKDDISIVPLAIPMLSGPGAMTTVVVLISKNPSPSNYGAVVASSAVTILMTYFIFRHAPRLMQLIGITGLNVLTRIMGLLIGAMAIQLMINGYVAIHR